MAATPAPPPKRGQPEYGLVARQRSFAGVLGRELAGGGAARQTPEQRARATAEQLVAVTFIQPLLKQLRETNHAAPPFGPTQAERQFGALADADLAQQVTRAAHFPLVDRLAQDLLIRSGMDRAQAALAASPLRPEAAPGVNDFAPRSFNP